MDWTDQTDSVIEGCGRFLDRVWRLAVPADGAVPGCGTGPLTDEDLAIRRATHRLIARVSRDFERWSYNTAVAACMEFVNLLQPYVRDGGHAEVIAEAVDTLLLLLAPMTPHVTAEAWERRHGDHVHAPPLAGRRPGAGRRGVGDDGRPGQRQGARPDRGAPRTSPRTRPSALALASPPVVEALAGAAPRRVIARPPKLVNVVV